MTLAVVDAYKNQVTCVSSSRYRYKSLESLTFITKVSVLQYKTSMCLVGSLQTVESVSNDFILFHCLVKN